MWYPKVYTAYGAQANFRDSQITSVALDQKCGIVLRCGILCCQQSTHVHPGHPLVKAKSSVGKSARPFPTPYFLSLSIDRRLALSGRAFEPDQGTASA